MRNVKLAAFWFAAAVAQGASLVPAQAAPPKPPVAPAPEAKQSPAVTVLGAVEHHRVALADVQTLFDTFFAAKPLPAASKSSVLVVRCSADGLLCLRVDVLAMMKTGRMADNIVMRDGDLMLLPSAAMVAAAKRDVDLVDAVVREAKAEHWPAEQRARLAAWRLLSEADAVKRHDCVIEFGKLAADGAVALAPLTKALGGDVAIARDAATALGLIGAAAAPALPELKKAAEGTDAQLASRCKAAVRAIEVAIERQAREKAK